MPAADSPPHQPSTSRTAHRATDGARARGSVAKVDGLMRRKSAAGIGRAPEARNSHRGWLIDESQYNPMVLTVRTFK